MKQRPQSPRGSRRCDGSVLLLVIVLMLLVSAMAIHLMRLATVETRLAAQLARRAQLELGAAGVANILARELGTRAELGCALPTAEFSPWAAFAQDVAPPVGPCAAAAELPPSAADLLTDLAAISIPQWQATVTRLTPDTGGGQPLRLPEAQASSALALRTDLFELGVLLEQGGLSASAAVGLAIHSARSARGTP